MIIHQCQQGTEEWHALRLGKVTASHFKDVLNKKTGRETYMWNLLAERLSGCREESYSNQYMEDGIEREAEARDYYEFVAGHRVTQVGFVESTADVGCSPDGLCGDSGMVEIKCPKLTTHLQYILKGALPAQYKAQVQGQIWVCQRQWCDFVSYHPDYRKQPIFIHRVECDEVYLTQLSASVAAFVTEMKELEAQL